MSAFWSRAHSVLLRWQVAVLLLAPTLVQAAIQHVPASRPFVFSDASVNVVVLQYQHTGRENALVKAGEQLSLLLQIECLRSILKFGSVGAVQIVAEPGREEECRADAVLRKLLGQVSGARTQVLEGHGIVMLSGRIYVEGEEIWLQSYVRFLRRGSDGTIVVPVGERTLSGRLATQSFSFPHRRLTRKDVSEIESLYGAAGLIRSGPSETADARPLPPSAQSRGFAVVGHQGSWIHIAAFDGSWDGWLPAKVDLGAVSLDRRLPEIAFVEALTGYLQFLQEREVGEAASLKRLSSDVASALDRYESRSGDSAGSVPLAIGRQIRGAMALLAPGPSPDTLRYAQEQLSRAATILPRNADARNLEGVMRLRLGSIAPMNARATADRLTAAIGFDPGNREVLKNLESYYQLLLDGKTLRVTEEERAEVLNRLKVVESVRGSVRAPEKDSPQEPRTGEVVKDSPQEPRTGEDVNVIVTLYEDSRQLHASLSSWLVSSLWHDWSRCVFQDGFTIYNHFRRKSFDEGGRRVIEYYTNAGDGDSFYIDQYSCGRHVSLWSGPSQLITQHGQILHIDAIDHPPHWNEDCQDTKPSRMKP